MTKSCETCQKRGKIHPDIELYVCKHEDMPLPFVHGRYWPVLCNTVIEGQCPLPAQKVQRDKWGAVKV